MLVEILASLGGAGAVGAAIRWVWMEWRAVRRENVERKERERRDELAAAERLAVALDRSTDAQEATAAAITLHANNARELAQRVEDMERALNVPSTRRATRAITPPTSTEDSKR
jgi:hypothetical protein